jgi:thiamine biosynthesis lipoprotein
MKTEHRHIHSMGTRLDLVFPGVDQTGCDKIMKKVTAELLRLERKLSIYLPDSELSLINRTAHAGPIWLDDELLSVFREIIHYHRESHGFFDVTMKPVFDFHMKKDGEEKSVPDEIRNRVGMEKIVIDEQGITFREKGMQIDMGGYGKGYAVKRIVSILESEGIDCALISFGESLVYGLGTHPYGDRWKVGVPAQVPNDPIVFNLNNNALSTSGNTLNNQKKFANSGHIVNPVTLLMKREEGLVSVKAADPLRAEVFSTALYSAGEKQSNEILKGIPDLEVKWLLPVE